MKTILGALALAIGTPAAAQTAPAVNSHAEHNGQQQTMDHGQHVNAKHDCKDCCEKMKNKDGKMECKDKTAEAKPAESGHDHGGHAH